MLRTTRDATPRRRFSDEPTQEGPAAGAERRGTDRSATPQPVWPGAGGSRSARQSRASGGQWGAVHGGGGGGGTALGRCRRALGRPLQPGRAGGALSRAWGWRSRALHERRAGARLGRSPAPARARARWDRHVVARDLTAGAAPRIRRVATGEHLHHLVRASGGGVELAAHADVVPDRPGGALAQARTGAPD